MRRLSLSLAFLALCAGCSHLVIKDDDHPIQIGAKVLTRLVLVFPTIGLSEMEIANAAEEMEARQQLAEYAKELTELVQAGTLDLPTAKMLYQFKGEMVWGDIAMKRALRGDAMARAGAALQGAGQGLSGGGSGYVSQSPPMPLFSPDTPSQHFTVTDPMTGQVSIGNVQTFRGGAQTYQYTDPSGHTSSSFVSPPMGGMRHFQTTDPQTGQTQFGTIQTLPGNR